MPTFARKSSGTGGQRRSFRYRERSKEDFKKQKQKTESRGYDSLFVDGVTLFKATEGGHNVRFMPSADEFEDHYAYEAWIHYNVGPNNSQYWCPAKFDSSGKTRCPICEESHRLLNVGEKSLGDALKVSRRLVAYIIDRNNEADGPKVWNMPLKVDKNLIGLVYDDDTNEVLFIDHPEKGHDVRFKRVGKGVQDTDYVSFKISHQETPLHAMVKRHNEWLDYIEENPLSSIFQIYSYEYLQGLIGAASDGVPEEEIDHEEQYGEAKTYSGDEEADEAEREDSYGDGDEEGHEFTEDSAEESDPEYEQPVRRRANVGRQFAQARGRK